MATKITLTNTLVANSFELTDPGSFTGPFAVKEGQRAYKSTDIYFQHYRVNVYEKLAAQGHVDIITSDPAAIAYYTNLNGAIDGLTAEPTPGE